jgi:hypothetical protein
MPDFDLPLFGASDGFAYLVDDDTLPGVPFRVNDGMSGAMPKVVLSNYGNTVYNPKHISSAADLDPAWGKVLAEYLCHFECEKAGPCVNCGVSVWFPEFQTGEDSGATERKILDPNEVVYSVGDLVFAKKKGISWSRGTIKGVTDGSCDVSFEDGSSEKDIKRVHIRLRSKIAEKETEKGSKGSTVSQAKKNDTPSEGKNPNASFQLGEKVEANSQVVFVLLFSLFLLHLISQ